MAVALGLVPVWYPKKANLALMPPQVAPMAVALGLVLALACCLVCHMCTPFFPTTSGILRPWGQLSLGPFWSTSRSTHCCPLLAPMAVAQEMFWPPDMEYLALMTGMSLV